MHISMILVPNAWVYDEHVWCMYLWSSYLTLMHVCMMHISMILDPNAWVYDEHVWCMCIWSSIFDPDACMCDACKKWGRINKWTNERTDVKLIIRVGLSASSNLWEKNKFLKSKTLVRRTWELPNIFSKDSFEMNIIASATEKEEGGNKRWNQMTAEGGAGLVSARDFVYGCKSEVWTTIIFLVMRTICIFGHENKTSM